MSSTKVGSRVLRDNADRRHLLRRLVFASTPPLERTLEGKTVEAALRSLIASSRKAPLPEGPAVTRQPWTNRTLRFTDTTNAEMAAKRTAVNESNARDAAVVREWWLQEMIQGPAPLRENLVLFFHSMFGGSSRVIDGPQPLFGYNALLRKHALGTIPEMLDAMVLDPSMILQESYDDGKKDKPPDFSATRIFDNWTIGAGNYTPADTLGLARALTGWVLDGPKGTQPPKPLDPQAFRSNKRLGLIPEFHPDVFDDGPKTILGTTRNFGARDAVQFLAQHELTARRFGKLMVGYFGVDDPSGEVAPRLAATYQRTKGSIEAMLRDLVLSEEFWSQGSRWKQVKSPAQLAVGVCRQLDLHNPPLAALDAWMSAAGQTLLDAPNFGGEGWPGQESWLDPGERLAVRFQLGTVLSGGSLPQALVSASAPVSSASSLTAMKESVGTLLSRLDPAPGLDARTIEHSLESVPSQNRSPEAVRQILGTLEYQLA